MKKKLNVILVLIAFALVIGSTGCTKDEEQITGMKNILTSKTWTFVKMEAPDAPADSQWFIEFAAAFYTGATTKFNNDGTMTQTIIGIPISGTYVISSDEKKITIIVEGEDGPETMIYYNVTVTASSLNYEENVDDETGTYNIFYYWK